MARTKASWAAHFTFDHKRRQDPSLEEMLKYPKAFAQVYVEHIELHRHFKTGHEHLEDGTIVPDA